MRNAKFVFTGLNPHRVQKLRSSLNLKDNNFNKNIRMFPQKMKDLHYFEDLSIPFSDFTQF